MTIYKCYKCGVVLPANYFAPECSDCVRNQLFLDKIKNTNSSGSSPADTFVGICGLAIICFICFFLYWFGIWGILWLILAWFLYVFFILK
jgi:hypothetical protein